MKLKLVVASMSILGLVSCPVLAATKHKHHNAAVAAQPAMQADYKDYKDMAPVCTIPAASMVMDGMTQNVGRSLPNPCNPGWSDRIALSGGINVDLGKFGSRSANFQGENYQRFSLNDAYINLSAVVNDWVHAFASISYNTATINEVGTGLAEYDAAYSNNVTSGSTSTIQLEQGYATIGNFDVSPFFLQVGKHFQDFGRYEIHPITESFTQVMSEVLATSGKLGFITNGFNGSLYVFDNELRKVGSSVTKTNYGISLGYDVPSDEMGWDVGAGYLYDLIGANNVAYQVNNWNAGADTYTHRAGGVAVYGDVNSGPFSIGVRYTSAVQRFSVLDLPKNLAATQGAKPWAADIKAGYTFDAYFGKNQNLYVGYSASREAAALDLPKSRWLLGYGIDVYKNTNVGIEWDHDKAFSTSNGGSGNSSNLVSIRSSVEFG